MRGVGDEDEIISLDAQIRRQRLARLLQQWADAPSQGLDRFGLQLALPALVGLEDGRRTCPEAAMIEEGDLRAQQEAAPRLGERRGPRSILICHAAHIPR
jgi:hypothetical protein